MKREALEIRISLDQAGAPEGVNTQTRLLRQQGKQLLAIWRFVRLTAFRNSEVEKVRMEEAIEALACVLDIIDGMQNSAIFRNRLARRFFSLAVIPLLRRATRNRAALPIASQGKIQTQLIRLTALLDDDDVRSKLGELWQIIHEQYSRADFYTDNGPLIPAFHLIEQSTAREEDRLAYLVEVNLELAGILLVAIRRRWPGGIEDVWKERDREKRYSMHDDFLTGQICAAVAIELLSDAQRIATALNEYGLQVAISKSWLKAEKILNGVSYWKQQRLYLPSTSIHADA